MVSGSVPFSDRVRLGDDFELDLRAFQLRKAGRPLKLERIPMDLLVMLVEHRGELVSRDLIIEKIWGKDVFLDTDASINSAIRKIRQALKDHPDQPRFVQTVSGRGYRFIGPIEQIVAAEAPSKRETGGALAIPGPTHVTAEQPMPTGVAAESAHGKRGWKAAAIAVVIAFIAAGAIAAVGYVSHRRAIKLTAEDTIVLGDFANSTGDAIFDDTLKQALTVSLRQSPFLNILGESKVRKTLKLMTLDPTATALTPGVAGEVCQRAGSKAYVSGAIGSLGSEYVLGLKAVNCRSGDVLAQEQATASSKEHVLRALGEAATKLRGQLGESLATVQKFDVPLTEATTSSLEALRAYSQGLRAWNTKGEAEALPHLKRALELDPQFASAWASLGAVYSNLERPGTANESMTKAYQLRERASDRERFYILGHYYTEVTGELEKALQAYEQWKQAYPFDPTPRTNAGNIYLDLGDYEKGLAQHRDALRVEPNGVLIYENIALINIYLNRLDDAVASVQAASAHNLDDVSLHALLFDVAFMRGDTAGLARETAWGMSTPGVQDAFMDGQGDVEATTGHIGKARELCQRAVDMAVRNGSNENAAEYRLHDALREAEVGNAEEAVKQADAALALATNQVTRYLSALAFARAGKQARAVSMANQLDRDYPVHDKVQNYWLPSIRAAVQMDHADAAGALKSLQVAIPYELGAPRPFVSMYPLYLRGVALLMSHQGPAAAAEFQKLMDHRTLTTFVTPMLSKLQLARAYAMSGDPSKARTGYQTFLSLWKDADPDIPILKQAKTEYAKLH